MGLEDLAEGSFRCCAISVRGACFPNSDGRASTKGWSRVGVAGIATRARVRVTAALLGAVAGSAADHMTDGVFRIRAGRVSGVARHAQLRGQRRASGASRDTFVPSDAGACAPRRHFVLTTAHAAEAREGGVVHANARILDKLLVFAAASVRVIDTRRERSEANGDERKAKRFRELHHSIFQAKAPRVAPTYENWK